MHGLLSNPGVINALLSYLYKKKRLDFIPLEEQENEDPYDQLAAHFGEHIDMNKIQEIFKKN
jgi:adenosylcobyric acid synthase